MEEIAAIPGVTRRALERLAEADAYRSLGLDRRAALWVVKGLDERTIARHGATEAAAPLFAAHLADGLFREEPVALPPMPLFEHVAEDYTSTGLSLKEHPCTFFRPMLGGLGAILTRDHRSEALRQNARITVAGLVLIRQQPGTAKGVVFLTLEDETGIANVIIWPKVFAANRRVAMTSGFLLVRGRIQRQGLVVHVLAETLVDLTPELRRLREGFAPPQNKSDFYGGADPRLLKSRDFH